ncbi:MAG: hypothetical protein LBR15_05545 [Methanobrevibacter sp.]|nr:hypothetical protein [Candidatus Methanovirga australis]
MNKKIIGLSIVFLAFTLSVGNISAGNPHKITLKYETSAVNVDSTFIITKEEFLSKMENNLDYYPDNLSFEDILNKISLKLDENGIPNKRYEDFKGVPYLECNCFFSDKKNLPVFWLYDIANRPSLGDITHYYLEICVNASKIATKIDLDDSSTAISSDTNLHGKLNLLDAVGNNTLNGVPIIITIEKNGQTSKTTAYCDDSGDFSYSLKDSLLASKGCGGDYHVTATVDPSYKNGKFKPNPSDIHLPLKYSLWVKACGKGAVWSKETYNAPNGVSISDVGGIFSCVGFYDIKCYDENKNEIDDSSKTVCVTDEFRYDMPAETKYVQITAGIKNDGTDDISTGIVPVDNAAIFFEGAVRTSNTHIKINNIQYDGC